MYQITMVIGAFMLLSFLTVTVNQAVINKTMDTYEVESEIAASTMAQALLQEVCLREFDEKSIGVPIDSASKLTASGSLGSESETYPFFDDIDDYKFFTRYDTVRNGVFKSRVNVTYVTSASPNDSTSTSSFYKQVEITVVTADASKMRYPVKLVTVISY
jgi:hypothetical protein